MEEDQLSRISQLLQRADEENTDDFLFEMIGKNRPDSIYSLPQDTPHLIEAGKEWFKSKSADIKKFVCAQQQAKGLSQSLAADLISIVFTYVDSIYGKALATYITAVVIRRVIAGWCGEPEGDS